MNIKAIVTSVVLASFAQVMFAEDIPEMIKVGGEGKLAIVNTCGVSSEPLEIALKKITNFLMINSEIQTNTWSLAESKQSFEQAKATAAVFVVKDKSLPMSLIAMEAKWGVVNAEGLSEKSVEKEVLRVATIILGGASSKYPASVMRPVFSADDLEKRAGDVVTFDALMAIFPNLELLGFKQFQMMSKEDVLAEGLIEAKDKTDAKK